MAEGVESPAEAELLKQMGCHLAQGYLFARPWPATDPFWQQEAGSPAS
ncbi:EAL domain-containing protein [Deinococcus sp. MIMF12]|uniref:EAL domain-containing protein n=1 Tax=Deinococcus rhizophilus TaxID=3049544 RepID=A0ABT7JFE7_9DEIO|nr:EAL domain-containing protein [Deinococcus rhizophilus]